jgi:signal transduction histidine kinase
LNLDERRFPADSIVEFREPSIWDRYHRYIIVALSLLVAQTILIAGLLIQRSRRRRAEAELRRSYEMIRNLGGRLLSAQETERAHIARELHDDIGQRMVALHVELQTVMSRLAGGALPENELLIAEARERAVSVTKSLRELSHRLHPAYIRMVGLTGALGGLQRELSTGDVTIVFSHENVPDSLSPDVMLSFYRVAQEALRNSVEHSRADRISIRLHGAPGVVIMSIDDNGVGFDVRAAQHGLGLISMRERVEQIGGQFELRLEPTRGTHVEMRVPCPTEERVEDKTLWQSGRRDLWPSLDDQFRTH